MLVRGLVWGPNFAAGYLAFDGRGGKAIAIDAPPGAAKHFIEIAATYDVEILMVVSTHGHWEHIADNSALVSATGAYLCGHAWDTARLANPHLTMFEHERFKVTPSVADRIVHDGEILEIGSMRLEILHTPGHTPGSICIYEKASGVLFSGDTLLRHSVGRTDVPGGNQDALSKSLRRLSALPDETLVYPGHGASTTIRDERWILEIARMDETSGKEGGTNDAG